VPSSISWYLVKDSFLLLPATLEPSLGLLIGEQLKCPEECLGVAVTLAAGVIEATSVEWRISDWDLVLGGELLSKGDEPLECFNVFSPMLALGVILEDADTDLGPLLGVGVTAGRGDFCPAGVSDSSLLLRLDA